jgi:hypothetical protein
MSRPGALGTKEKIPMPHRSCLLAANGRHWGAKCMRFFDLLNLQDIILYFFPAVLAILIVGIALGYVHFRTSRSEERMKRSYYTFPEDIEDRQAPFPLTLILIIAGAVVWAFLYILVIGLWGVKI